MGEWDYINNKDGVNKVLKSRVDECAPFENVYTLALRGCVMIAEKRTGAGAEKWNNITF